jgi:hypothetical protein
MHILYDVHSSFHDYNWTLSSHRNSTFMMWLKYVNLYFFRMTQLYEIAELETQTQAHQTGSHISSSMNWKGDTTRGCSHHNVRVTFTKTRGEQWRSGLFWIGSSSIKLNVKKGTKFRLQNCSPPTRGQRIKDIVSWLAFSEKFISWSF